MTTGDTGTALDVFDPSADAARRASERLRLHAAHLVETAEQLLAQAEAELCAALRLVSGEPEEEPSM